MLFRPGDVLLFGPSKITWTTLVPSLIRLITGNKVTHVGIVVDVKHYQPDWIVWTETFTGSGMRCNLSSVDKIREEGSDGLKFLGVSHLPDKLYQCYPIDGIFGEVSASLALDPKSKSYSYRTIVSFMIDHLYRLFFTENEPYRTWIKPNGYVCSTLCATIINETLKKYDPNWCGQDHNMNVWEPDDFTTDLFTVELCDLKIS